MDTQTDNPIFYKFETFLDCLLMPETYVMPDFVKIGRAVHEIYESCVYRQNNRQTDNPIFYKVETYIDHFLRFKICAKPNFVKIVRAVLEIVNIYIYTYTGCPKKVEMCFNFLAIEDKHTV